jgi:hypothetical protein
VRTAPRVRTPTAPGATKSIVVGVVSLFAMFTSRLFLYLVGRSLIGTSPSGFSAPGMGMFQALVVLAAFGPVAGSVAAIVIGRRASKAAAAGSRGFVRAQLGAAVGWIGVAIFVLGFFFSPLM